MIQTASLCKSFGKCTALNGLSFSADNGSVTGLIGPNGCGKTTTLRLIAGLLRPGSGRVLVDGVDPANDPLAARRLMGALTDGLGNYPRLTTREHLWYFGQLRGMSRVELESRTRYLLDLFDMNEIADRRAVGFSQGERMKLALARAMINDPPNILLDEPANGLDVHSTRALRSLLERLRDTGKCIVLCSHLMTEISLVCDKVVVVTHGRVAAQGSPADLMLVGNARTLEEAFMGLTS
ncbi:MAG TPA: ATP-binding cassette domain-containing protein [Bryobacteraceae bacterium]|jgi:sodium transport system ATP-binding protein|nr:ATP-binding cassette domain-containing protein [Bryobacteraceae bacterium]